MPSLRPKGFVAFTLVWFGQVISLMGSAIALAQVASLNSLVRNIEKLIPDHNQIPVESEPVI